MKRIMYKIIDCIDYLKSGRNVLTNKEISNKLELLEKRIEAIEAEFTVSEGFLDELFII